MFTVRLILYSWCYGIKKLFGCVKEQVHQSLCHHKWSDWYEPIISNCRRYDYERWMERKCELCYKKRGERCIN